MTLARRFIASSLWLTGAHVVAASVLLLRSILLARLLPVEVFGTYVLAATVVGLTAGIAKFGMGDALLHRAPETADEQRAAATHFSLTVLFSTLWAIALLGGAVVFFEGELVLALGVLTATQLGLHLAATPISVLRRRVAHRPLAVLQVLQVLSSTVLALGLAWAGSELWALLIIDVTVCSLSLVVLYAWRPVWRPRLAWDAETVRYFLRFGSRDLLGRVLEDVLRWIDKLWVGTGMDARALGIYSRAYAYGRAPTGLISNVLASVTTGVYAELAGDRRRLSRAMTRVTALLLRATCLLTVVAGLLAPELIVTLIGEKWLPMLDAFRILLAAFVFSAVGRSCVQLLIAVGRPEARAGVGLVQVAVMGSGLVLLGPGYGLVGVSVSVLLAALVGLALLLHLARRHVDLELARIFVPPLLAAGTGLVLGLVVGSASPADWPLWAVAAARLLACVAAYLLVLVALDGRPLRDDLLFVARQLRGIGDSGFFVDEAGVS